MAILSGRADDGDSWTLGENELEVSDRATHLGITRAGKKESEIIILDRISLARRTSYLLMNTGLHGTNGLNPETSYVIYKCYVLPRMLYRLEVIHLAKTPVSPNHVVCDVNFWYHRQLNHQQEASPRNFNQS